MGKFEIKKRANKEFQFNLRANNGEIILSSETYTTKANCKKGIASVIKNSPDDAKYAKKQSKNGKWYFTLKAANGQIVGTSEMYESEKNRNNGIASVKRNAADAKTEDLTTRK